jgi:hypothetical protein
VGASYLPNFPAVGDRVAHADRNRAVVRDRHGTCGTVSVND